MKILSKRSLRLKIISLLHLAVLLPLCAFAASDKLPGSQFVGVWEPIGNFRKLNTEPVFTPEIALDIKRQTKLREKGDYSGDNSANCIPPALPTMISIGVQEILVDKKKMTWIMESSSGIRWIWLDGRKHPNLDELRPKANGHSIGHFEGDVLVVDSIGFLNRAIVYVNRKYNESVYPSPKMHVIERMRVTENGNVIISDRTVTDPANFTEPWHTTVRYERRPDWEIEENICAENNRTEEYE
jgi:hypothetical protein